MATISVEPLFQQGNTYAGDDLRALVSSLHSEEGVVPALEYGTEALKVTETSPQGLQVQVAAGSGVVQDSRGSNGSNRFLLTSGATQTTVTLTTADPSNPRIDRIVLRVESTEMGDASNAGTLEAVAGTPAGSPSAPATPTGSISLATVAVSAGATTIADASITDTRTYASPNYAVPQGATASRPSSPVTGQLYSNTDSGLLEFWNGSTWVSTGGATLIYGDSDDTGYSVATGVTTDTAASVTFTTTDTNTVWLIEITAQASFPSSAQVRGELYAKIDGASTDTDGVYGLAYTSNVGQWPERVTIRGRLVTTLATAASHTILAQVFSSGGTTTYDTVTITATQLAS